MPRSSRSSTTPPTSSPGSPMRSPSATHTSISARSTSRPMAHAPAVPIEELFVRSGALRDGHFLLKSGRHSGRYLEKFLVLQYPDLAVEIGRRFAAVLAPLDPTLVVGPTTGGVLLAFETARQLQPLVGHEVRGIFAEPSAPGRRKLRRGWP